MENIAITFIICFFAFLAVGVYMAYKHKGKKEKKESSDDILKRWVESLEKNGEAKTILENYEVVRNSTGFTAEQLMKSTDNFRKAMNEPYKPSEPIKEIQHRFVIMMQIGESFQLWAGRDWLTYEDAKQELTDLCTNPNNIGRRFIILPIYLCQ